MILVFVGLTRWVALFVDAGTGDAMDVGDSGAGDSGAGDSGAGDGGTCVCVMIGLFDVCTGIVASVFFVPTD